MGRPISLTPEIIESICEHIADGGTLRAWCRENGKKPSSVLRWLWSKDYDENEFIKEFRNQYACARICGAEVRVDEIVEISDDFTQDPARSRLRVDTRKWLASKVHSKLYGDKITQEHTGAGGGPIKTEGVGFPPQTANYAEWLAAKKAEEAE